MPLSSEHTRDQTETSCFGLLSPPSDPGDAPSAPEAYALQPQLNDIEEQPHSHEEYSPDEGGLTGELYAPFVPAEQAGTSAHGATPPHLLDPYSFSPLSPLPSLSAPSLPGLQPDVPQHIFHSSTSAPPQALDLANASLEMTFADNNYDGYHNYSFDPDASPFMQDKQLFHTNVLRDFSSFSDPAASSSGFLSPLPSVSMHNLSDSTVCSTESFDIPQTVSPAALHQPNFSGAYASDDTLLTRGRLYSPRFPVEHKLDLVFVRSYLLGDELGAGGYGFVMTARHRTEGNEVAVKFIIKSKVPDHAWVDDGYGGRVPAEVMLLGGLEHPNIVKCFELYEDETYYYMVQELHGTPWVSKKEKKAKQPTAPGSLCTPSASSPPLLTPSLSNDSMFDSVPPTPYMSSDSLRDLPSISVSLQSPMLHEQGSALFAPPHIQHPSPSAAQEVQEKAQGEDHAHGLLRGPLPMPLPLQVRPNFSRRPSYDLFECIEQSKYKRLSENQARYIFAQVVEAVYHLDSKGITHCDIKDENLLVDSDLRVKLIDFGSAVWVDDPSAPRPYYHQFYGTTAYASSEILRKMPYRAPPAEIWTLGVLLSYLLTGHSPFPTELDAIEGRITLRELGSARLSRAAISLIQRCLERDPDRRADIVEVRGHRWLVGALERGGQDQ